MLLGVTKLKRIHYQPIFDKLHKKSRGWNKLHMSISDRVTLIRSVLYAIPTFQLLAIDPNPWMVKKLGKLYRGFLWANKDEAPGGKCMI